MTSKTDREPYVLSYRRDNVEEDIRLNTQREVIKHGILDGLLVHPSIGILDSSSAIADLGCGTGLWLNDVAKTLFTSEHPATLIGFDTNAHAFTADPAPGVQLVEHDCTLPFDARYIRSFDLVNIRGLACALSEESFARVIGNAVSLLKPSGYLQWLETEPRLWMVYPETAEIAEALDMIDGAVASVPEVVSLNVGVRTLMTHETHFSIWVPLDQSALSSGICLPLIRWNGWSTNASRPSDHLKRSNYATGIIRWLSQRSAGGFDKGKKLSIMQVYCEPGQYGVSERGAMQED